MSFVIRNLSVLNYANVFTLWHYKSTVDTLEIIRAPDYFGDVADMLSVGDMMMIVAQDGSTIISVTNIGTNTAITAPLS